MPSLARTSAALISRIVSSVTGALYAVRAWINYRAGLLLFTLSSFSVFAFGDRDFLKLFTFWSCSCLLWLFRLEVDLTTSCDWSLWGRVVRLTGDPEVKSFSTRRFAPKFSSKWTFICSILYFYSSTVSGTIASVNLCLLNRGWIIVYLILCLINFLVCAIALYFLSDSSPLCSNLSWLDFLIWVF
jgi:hypothetical protein